VSLLQVRWVLAPGQQVEIRGNMRKIVIADDDAFFSAAVQFKFTSEGYDVSAVGDGRDLVDELSSCAPDLVLLDLEMPGMSGVDVLQRMREDPQLSSIPVLVVTSEYGSGTRARCLRLGAAGFCSKPVSLSTLAARVRACLT
jgi:DNA-binding response OmpR family regulator